MGCHIQGCARRAVVLLLVVMTGCVTMEPPHQPIVEAANPVIPCPSQDFGKFFQVYAESSDIQRQYMLLPLQHSSVEAGAEKAIIKLVRAYEEVPWAQRAGGFIFPNKASRTKERYVFRETGPRYDIEDPEERKFPGDKVILLGIMETGFAIYYRFTKTKGCWFLHAIHEHST